jgi:hypothetical protein
MRGHEANTSLLNDNLAKKQTLRTEKLQATGLMTRRHIRLRKVSEPHSRVELTFATASDEPHPILSQLLTAGLLSVGPSGLNFQNTSLRLRTAPLSEPYVTFSSRPIRLNFSTA